MKIGVPKEIKNNESRVALTPGGVQTMVKTVMPFMLKQMPEQTAALVTNNTARRVRKYYLLPKKYSILPT